MKQTKLFSTLMLLVMITLMPQGAWAGGTQPTSGSGTTGDPYIITSADELIWFRDAVNGTNTGTGTGTGICAKVTADFQVENQNWAGIGTSSKNYTGTFDGNNKTIYIKHLSATGDNFGLFGYINGATIKDLTIAPPNNGNSYVFTSSYDNVGTVVGRADGASKILNVKSSIDLTISGAKSHIGGIVGYIQNTTQVSGCTYSGTINADSSKDCIGGIVGFSYKDFATTITNCFFSGSITTTASDGSTWPDNYVLMGGILGYVNDETTNGTFGGVKNCFSAGTLTAESATKRQGIGAIIGAPRGKAIHDNNVTGNYYINGTTALGNNNADNATNKKITISVSSNNGNYGTVSTSYVSPTTSAATLLQVTATPADHYHFVGWSDSGNQTHSVELTNDINLTATFAIDQHTITIKRNYDYRSTISCTLNGSPFTLSEVQDASDASHTNYQGTFNYGAEPVFTVTPAQYCEWSKWSDGNTDQSRTYQVTGDATLTANCNKAAYTIVLAVNNENGGTVSGTNTADAFNKATFTATPAEHYHFVKWTDDHGNEYTTTNAGTGNTCTTDANGVNTLVIGKGNITQNTTYTAHFAGNEYTITLNPTTNGTISQSSATGKYTYPAQVTLTATPAEHYHFVSWSDGQGNTYTTAQPGEGNTCTTDANGVNTLQVPVTANQTYTATFAIDRHQVTAVPNNAAYGSVEISNKADDNTYDYGTNLILTATPASNMYRFVGWKLNGNTVSTNASYPITVSGDSAYTAEFEYCLNIVNNVLMGWNSNWPAAERPTSITIPEGVTSIYSSAFNGCTNLQSVTFPASIKSMGLSVFKGCTNLSSVNVAEGCQLTTFAERTFEGCTSLSSITIPASVTSIDSYAFNGCTNLSSITIPASVTTIGQYTFDNCSSLSSVTFAENSQLTTIGQYAFNGCTQLASVTFAENSRLTTIDQGAFKNCSNLSSITIPASVTTIGDYVFWGCTSLSSVTMLPTTVPTLGSSVFNNCHSSLTIKVPCASVSNYQTSWSGYAQRIVGDSEAMLASVIAAPNNADWGTVTKSVSGCSVTLTATPASNMCRFVRWSDGNTANPHTVTASGTYTAEFESCLNIENNVLMGWNSNWPEAQRPTSITIPASVTVIDTLAFYHCDSLSSVTFADNSRLGTIGQGAFMDCSKLSSITIPASVSTIGESAFNECLRLSSITIPASVTTIGDGAFWHCSNLSSVTFADNSRLGSIGQGAFWNCSNLSSITIPASVTTIGDNVFFVCSNLQTVTFADNSRLGTIGQEAFRDCSKLSSITIPASVTTIGQGAFNGCDTLQTVTMLRTAAPTLGDDVFGNCHDSLTIKVPCESVSNYQNKWSTWQSKIVGDSEAMLASVNVEANNADWGTVTKSVTDCSVTLTATPVDSMYRFVHWRGGNTDNPRTVTTSGTYIAEFEYFLNIDEQNRLTGHKNWPPAECPTSIIIPASVTEIDQGAFMNCSNLSSITIPASVSTIGRNAFQDCTNLSSVTFADGSELGTISESTFKNCLKLSSITIPASVGTIGKEAFYHCTSLSSVIIPASVTTIGEHAFKNCTNLSSVTFADDSNLLSIDPEAFRGCTKLSSITIPALVSTIGENAFYDCVSLSSVTFADDSQLNSIGDMAFLNCTSLSSVTIPASVSTIGNKAFRDCTNLSSVTMLPTEVPNMGSGVFDNCHSNLTIIVPCASLTAYQNATNWSGYAQRIEGDSEAMLASVNVVANNADWGTVTKSVTDCEVTLTATPASGYMFSHWINPDGSITHADATLYPANPTTEGQYTAVFKEEMSSSTSLCFMAQLPNSTVQLKANGTPTAITFETSTDGNTWTTYTLGTDITLRNIGDMVYFRNSAATAATTFSTSLSNYYQFVMSGKIAASGNVMSLMDKSLQKTDLTGTDHAFYKLFYGCSSLTTAPTLPATTLAEFCYYSMFSGCSSLTTAPALPATTLAKKCYWYMFSGCSSLTTAPALPATSLQICCYANMFTNCRSLTTAPALPATTLAGGCYQEMFYGCSSLKSAPILPATTLAQYCYENMFYGCSSLTISNNLSASWYEWTIPAAASAADMSCWNNQMFDNNGAPAIGTTYYTDHAPVAPGIKLNSAGYATYSAYFNAHIVSAGVAAYKAEVSGTTITLTRLEGDIPAGTGVILYGENMGGTNVEITTHNTSDAIATVGTNHLKPSTLANGLLATMPTGMVVYVLDPASGNVFRQYSGIAFIHNRAYFEFNTALDVQGAPMRIVFAEDIATGAESVEATGESAVKLLENGHIVILKNGVRYSVTGQRIK